MSHDLRTPLNAMLGFSEAMQRELHGPLGSARYLEYAAHITESGGRLLKASEDAIAVAATMSALLADRRAPRRERLPAAGLVREAWAALGASERAIRLSIEGCAAVEIECNRHATSQALQHLLAEAASRAAPSGAVTARSVGDGVGRSIEIAAEASSSAVPAEDGLRVILARSLIEMQGGTLSLCEPHTERWSLRVGFPAAPPTLHRRRGPTSAAARRPGAPVSRGGFAAAAASHASAGSRAAPPA
jgi:signal transduction histidine kinase